MECTIKTNRFEIYKCDICGNIVEVMSPGMQALVCCKQPMKIITENTVDAAKEKHVPVIEKTTNGYKVIVGNIAHPMEAKHYIQWIELIADNQVLTQYLQPGEPPEALFRTTATQVTAREYCNIHGQWSAKNY